jgi:hypothetical protein
MDRNAAAEIASIEGKGDSNESESPIMALLLSDVPFSRKSVAKPGNRCWCALVVSMAAAMAADVAARFGLGEVLGEGGCENICGGEEVGLLSDILKVMCGITVIVGG